MHDATYRYMTIPDTLISPQAVLLYRFSVAGFDFVNTLLLYAAGFIGLLALRKQLRLSLFAFTAVCLLYNFNGNILAHYGVGHSSWGGYYLFSWFIWLMLRLVDGDRSWRWTFYTAILLFLMWLQGSYHHYLWLLMFLAFSAITIRGSFWVCLRTGLFVFLVSAFRLFPAVLMVGNYFAPFMSGFPSLYALWEALINPGSQLNLGMYFPDGMHGVGAWEFNTNIGLAAALALVYFGIYRGLVRSDAPFRALWLPLTGILFFSLSQVFAWVRLLPLPLIQGERVPMRMILVVLSFLIVLAAERIQRWLDNAQPNLAPRIGSTLVLLVTVLELWLNIQVWNVTKVEKISSWIKFDVHKWYIANQMDDTLYINLIIAGLVVSIVTIIALAVISWKEGSSNRRSSLP